MSDCKEISLNEALDTIKDLELQVKSLKKALTRNSIGVKLITIELEKNMDGEYEVIQKILY